VSYEEIDPEVEADIALRERTVRERRGMSETGFAEAIREAATPRIVDQVPCRGRCGGLCDWTAEAEEQFAMFNRELLRRREAPLDKTRIVFCQACIDRAAPIRATEARKHVEYIADLVRRVKASSNPEGERELLEKLKKASHPDIPGLLEALRTRGQKQPGTRARKGGM
jgi:hypothetical protein